MTTSIKDFTKNFKTLNAEHLKTIVGGNGELVQPLVDKKKKPRF